MRVLSIVAVVIVISGACLCIPDEGSKRKYVTDLGFRHQVDRLEEIIKMGIFSNRHDLSIHNILDFLDLILEILDALEPLLPT
ncbi:hypothetical protein B566_EDAN001564, partial [Ephemera danica]